MEDCKSSPTPMGMKPPGADRDGAPFMESWEYPSIVGMLMYLAGNSRPDIAHAVHACARHSHSPRASHARAVKHILRYLQGTRDKGLYFRPTRALTLDCYVDSDFGGLYGVENDQEPVCVKSRTGYVIMFRGCPLLWVSKLQTQIALSTMEAEYIALSASMRDLIPLREILKEIQTYVFEKKAPKVVCRAESKAFEEVKSDELIPSSTVYEDTAACLKFARLPRLTPRTKHIAVPYHWYRTKVEQLEIKIDPISTDDQLADQFTKSLSPDKFVKARKALMGW